MNYKLIYDELINNAKLDNSNIKIFETHHIIPKGHWCGKKHSSETILIMRKNNLGELNPQSSKPRTIEERAKISKSMTGIPKSPATIENLNNVFLVKKANKR